MEIRLKSALLVSAEIRRCEGLFVNAVVLHRGDEERGMILVKKYVHGSGAKIYMQGRDEEGNVGWQQPLGEDWVSEQKADQYIARQRNYDEDLWVVEVEDVKNVYEPGK